MPFSALLITPEEFQRGYNGNTTSTKEVKIKKKV